MNVNYDTKTRKMCLQVIAEAILEVICQAFIHSILRYEAPPATKLSFHDLRTVKERMNYLTDLSCEEHVIQCLVDCRGTMRSESYVGDVKYEHFVFGPYTTIPDWRGDIAKIKQRYVEKYGGLKFNFHVRCESLNRNDKVFYFVIIADRGGL